MPLKGVLYRCDSIAGQHSGYQLHREEDNVKVLKCLALHVKSEFIIT